MSAYQETGHMSGHIIDSLVLAKVLDIILMMGGNLRYPGRSHRKNARRSLASPYRHPFHIGGSPERHSHRDSAAWSLG
jgi:hypothetical protein